MTIRRKAAVIDADRIEFLLAKKYSAPMYAFMPQLRNGTGYQSRQVRTADAIAFSLWPSRGLYLHGFEVKVNRGDWLSELKQPEKAEEHAQFCHFWSLVIAEGIADPMEVPLGWGLIVVSADGELTEVRRAPEREPKPLTLAVIAAMFRNVNESIAFLKPSYIHVDDVDERVKAEAERISERTQSNYKRSIDQHEELLKNVKEFEAASGVNIASYGGKRIGAAVSAVLRIGADEVLRDVTGAVTRAQRTLERTQEELATAVKEMKREVTTMR